MQSVSRVSQPRNALSNKNVMTNYRFRDPAKKGRDDITCKSAVKTAPPARIVSAQYSTANRKPAPC